MTRPVPRVHSLRKLKWKPARVDMSLFGKVVRRCCHKIDIDTRNWEHQSRFRWIVSFLPINRKYRGNWLLLLSLFLWLSCMRSSISYSGWNELFNTSLVRPDGKIFGIWSWRAALSPYVMTSSPCPPSHSVNKYVTFGVAAFERSHQDL